MSLRLFRGVRVLLATTLRATVFIEQRHLSERAEYWYDSPPIDSSDFSLTIPAGRHPPGTEFYGAQQTFSAPLDYQQRLSARFH
jgi:hypothetical protein